jgi:hypothetical protein
MKKVPEIGVPPISITDFKAGKKAIKFSLINYKMTKIEEKLTGYLPQTRYAEIRKLFHYYSSH